MTGSKRLGGLSVLIVEDDYFLAEDARHALESAGARVLGPFARIEEAEELVHSTRPDCALLDINLGSGPDFTVAKTLLEQDIPVVFVTGYDAAIIPSELSHVNCLQKPTTPNKIIGAVEQLCNR